MSKQSRRPGRASRPTRQDRRREPGIDDLARTVAYGGTELLTIDDPLLAEEWASSILGTFYKLPVPLDVREAIDRDLVPAIARLAEAKGDPTARAVLEALAAVAEPRHGPVLREAIDRLDASAIPAPPWAGAIGSVELTGAWIVTDVFGDHEGYYAAFRYPGAQPHVVNALVDKALGEIVKDATVGYLKQDDPLTVLRELVADEDGLAIDAVDPAAMARRVVDAIEDGDRYLDNDWTQSFVATRALLLARMRTLPLGEAPEPPEVSDDERREIVDAFLASADVGDRETTALLAETCLDYTCDYLGEGLYRWSPIVVEMFLLDYLPRKVSLSLGELRALPDVLRAWIRFALLRRGLEARWIEEAVEAVATNEPAFLEAATDSSNFGPAKEIASQMLADGVDFADATAVQAWIDEYNDLQKE